MSLYLQAFGFRQSPFRISPDDRFLFLSEAHRLALSYLEYTALTSDGFMVLTGDVGAGKTVLLQRLAHLLSDTMRVVYINQTNLPAIELLKIFLYELTGTYVASGEAELLIRLKEELLNGLKNGQRTLLIIDEAQNLEFDAIEQLRLLSDEQYASGNIVNVILSGQPQLARRLDEADCEQIRQRVRINFHLTALNEEGVRNYIRYRLLVGLGVHGLEPHVGPLLLSRPARWLSRLFSDEVMEAIHRYAHGVPRLINLISETALVIAYGEGSEQVLPQHVEAAFEELGWVEEDAHHTAELTATMGASRMEPLLTIEAADREGNKRVETFFRLPVRIGRVRDNDLVLDDSTVSKHHAEVVREGGVFYLMDLGSTNGIKINGRRVKRRRLKNGDLAMLGKCRVRFSLGGAS